MVPQTGQVIVGGEAIGAVLQQFLALRGTMKMYTVDIIEAGDVALLRAHWRLAGTGPDGKPLEIQGHSVESSGDRAMATGFSWSITRSAPVKKCFQLKLF